MDDKSFTIRVPRKWARVVMIVGVAAMIVAPLTAVASHSFNDVPSSHTFHADISWLADAGVTKGCNPPTNTEFCPEDNVTRGQMGAFIRRFAQYIDAEDGTPAQADNANTLDGKNGTAYETRVVADGCKVNTSATATSCGDDPTGSVPDQTTRELARTTLNAPSTGTVVISGYNFGNTTNWFSLNESCAPYAPSLSAIFAQLVNGVLFGGSTASTGSGTTAVEVSSGSQTIRLCGAYEGTDDGGLVFSASLTTSWSAGGSASIAGGASSDGTPLSTDGLLGG